MKSFCLTIVKKWSHIRSSSGTAGTFLKSESVIDGRKKYYKLSNFDPVNGVLGYESVNEIIVDRLLTVLGVGHLSYELIHADIEIEGNVYNTYICASEDFKERGESKIALDDYYRTNAKKGESHYDFCVRCGWQEYIDRMIAVDYLILNRDRRCQNFIGGYSCYENLELIRDRGNIFKNSLCLSDRHAIFDGLETILSNARMNKIWSMIYERYQIYENL